MFIDLTLYDGRVVTLSIGSIEGFIFVPRFDNKRECTAITTWTGGTFDVAERPDEIKDKVSAEMERVVFLMARGLPT